MNTKNSHLSAIKRGASFMIAAFQAASALAAAPDLTVLAALGDSLLAGYRDGGLVDAYQRTSIPALIARQAQVSFEQPLIAWPGFPAILQLKQGGFPPVVEQAAGTSPGRVDMTIQARNLAVPGQTVREAVSRRPDLPIDSMTDIVLGLPGLLQGYARSQVEWAEALKPTTILVWIGNNDALNAAIYGLPTTPEEEFRAAYTELMDRLAATGATLVVANIPDVATIPYLVPVRALGSALQLPDAVLTGVLGVSLDDFVNLDAVAEIGAILRGQKTGPLEARYVITTSEVAEIRAATQKYNAIIAAQIQAKGAIAVDTAAYLNELLAKGEHLGNRHLSASYLGGIFGLDGIHPTADGSMSTANQFIAALNRAGAAIPPLSWLKTTVQGGDLVVSWPVTTPSYTLQTSSRPDGGWQTHPNVLVNGGNNEARLRIDGASRSFFRLARN